MKHVNNQEIYPRIRILNY